MDVMNRENPYFRRCSLQEINVRCFSTHYQNAYISYLKRREEEKKMAPYGRHVDVSHLTDEECSKVIDVISKDILLRKSEKDRVAYLNKKLEDFRRTITIAHTTRKKRIPFNDYCLICGKNLFTFICLLNMGEECISCEHQCCSTCRKVLILEGDDWVDRCYMCKLCLEKRECKKKSFEWFHEIVDKRFKRFGSAKILRAVYKQRSAIEPRVITLLAHCRELQPTRRMSISSLQKRYSVVSYTKHDNKVTYSSSYSNLSTAEKPLMQSRTKYHSESEVVDLKEDVAEEPHSNSDISRSRSASEANPRDKETVNIPTMQNNDTLIEVKKEVVNKPKRKISTPVKPEHIIMESREEEELAVAESRKFSKVDYLGLMSITLTVCFIVALFTCIGFVFEVSESRKPEDEDVE